jgi:hypothetical protein
MKKIRVALVGLLVISLVGLGVGCVPGAKPVKVTIYTGGTAGTYYPLGGAMAKIITDYAPGVEATAVTSGASVTNARKIAEKEADIVLIQNDVTSYAYYGTELFEGEKVENIRGLATLYPEIIQIIALKGISAVSDLKGKKVGIGAPGSGTAVDILQILNAAGVTRENSDLRDLDFKEVASALKDKTIDAGCLVAGIPTAAVTDVATVREIMPVEVPDAIYDKIKSQYPFYVKVTIPAGTYKGQDKDVETVAVLAMLAVRSGLSTDAVYQITKAIFEHTDILVATHKRAEDITLETALDGMPIPLHPGAEKYFKEKGLI